MFRKSKKPKECVITAPKGEICLPVADTMMSRARGMSFKQDKSLPGMVFAFNKIYRPAFWMFGMQFPIDIVWIKGGEVVSVDRNVPRMWTSAVDILGIRRPPVKINIAIELPVGVAEKLGIKARERISIRYIDPETETNNL